MLGLLEWGRLDEQYSKHLQSVTEAYELQHLRLRNEMRTQRRRDLAEIEYLKQRLRVQDIQLTQLEEQRTITANDVETGLEMVRYRHAWILTQDRLDAALQTLTAHGLQVEGEGEPARQKDYDCSSPISPFIQRPGKRNRDRAQELEEDDVVSSGEDSDTEEDSDVVMAAPKKRKGME